MEIMQSINTTPNYPLYQEKYFSIKEQKIYYLLCGELSSCITYAYFVTKTCNMQNCGCTIALVISVPIPNGEMMIVNLRYNKITGMLQSLGNFTLAEGNHLVDEVVITSTDPDRERYNYAIEFCLYNYKHIPKTLYISPILQYTNRGICFTIPNQLTQVPGYVTAQLIGYDPTDQEVLFKSVAKNAVCFWVEESHKVLESELSQTPNVLTHLMSELSELKDIKQNFVEDFSAQIKNDMGAVLEGYEYCKVEWVFYDHTEVQVFKKNSKIVEPKYSVPSGCEDRGWIEEDTLRTWSFRFDRVQKSIRLVQSFSSNGLYFDENKVTKYTGKESEIYLPISNMMTRITTIQPHVFDHVKNACIHLPISLGDIAALSCAKLAKVYGGKNVSVLDDILYMNGGKTLVKCMSRSPKIVVKAGCEKILPKAFEVCVSEQVELNSDLREIGDNAFENMPNLSKITLGSGIKTLGENLVKGCTKLSKVQCLAVDVPTMSASSWAISADAKVPIFVLGNIQEEYQNSLEKLGYTINVIGSKMLSKSKLESIEKTVQTNTDNIAKNSNSIGQLDTKVTNLGKQVNNKVDVSTLNTKMSELQGQINGLKYPIKKISLWKRNTIEEGKIESVNSRYFTGINFKDYNILIIELRMCMFSGGELSEPTTTYFANPVSSNTERIPCTCGGNAQELGVFSPTPFFDSNQLIIYNYCPYPIYLDEVKIWTQD